MLLLGKLIFVVNFYFCRKSKINKIEKVDRTNNKCQWNLFAQFFNRLENSVDEWRMFAGTMRRIICLRTDCSSLRPYFDNQLIILFLYLLLLIPSINDLISLITNQNYMKIKWVGSKIRVYRISASKLIENSFFFTKLLF